MDVSPPTDVGPEDDWVPGPALDEAMRMDQYVLRHAHYRTTGYGRHTGHAMRALGRQLDLGAVRAVTITRLRDARRSTWGVQVELECCPPFSENEETWEQTGAAWASGTVDNPLALAICQALLHLNPGDAHPEEDRLSLADTLAEMRKELAEMQAAYERYRAER